MINYCGKIMISLIFLVSKEKDKSIGETEKKRQRGR